MSASSNLSGQFAHVKSIDSSHKFSTTKNWWSKACPSSAAYRLLILLARFDNPKRGCFPSITRLALELGCKKRVVLYHLAYLERLGLISRQRGRNITFFKITYDPASAMELLPQVQVDCTSTSASGSHLLTIEQTTKSRLPYFPAGAGQHSLHGPEDPEGDPPSTPAPRPHPQTVRGPFPTPETALVAKGTDSNGFRVSRPREVVLDSTQPRRAYTPLHPTLAALMQQFQAECRTITDDTYSNRNAAKSLLKTYGNIADVMQAAHRAKSKESLLCRNGERFTLGAVLYYARKFDKSIDAKLNEAERTAKLREMLDDAWQSREFIGFYNLVQVFSVSDEQVQQWYGAEGLVALRRSASDRSANETVEDSQAVC